MKPTTGCSDTGPEFDRLKTIKEVSLNADLVAFVEKAHSSLQPEDALSNGIVTRDLSFITLPWGTVKTSFSIFCKASRMLILVTSGGGHHSPGLLSTAHWLLRKFYWSKEQTPMHWTMRAAHR
jgi:hypothetical protein